MSANYEPGTVAVATVRGVPNVRVVRYDTGSELGWWQTRGRDRYHLDDEVTDIRPLVVLDLGVGDVSPQQQAAFVVEILRQPGHSWCEHVADQIAAQTKPKPAEPTGLGAVVEDGMGKRWVHVGDGWWDHYSRSEKYIEIDVVRVLSEGVTS